MNQNKAVYIIDVGNTLLKIAKFVDHKIVDLFKVDFDEIDSFPELLVMKSSPCFASSVLDDFDNETLKRKLPNLRLFDNTFKTGIVNKYKSPDTLGYDRLCNVIGASDLSNNLNCLTIDIGTCIKFDFITAKKEYLGGSIGPGINLRFKAMNDYTKNLPYIKHREKTELIGRDTKESLMSGVMNGMQAEINQFIERYKTQFSELQIFMTGGDAKYFDIPLKKDTFVVENLTLLGLYKIYELNEI